MNNKPLGNCVYCGKSLFSESIHTCTPQPKQEQRKCDNCGEFGECCQQPKQEHGEPDLGGVDVLFPVGITRPSAEEVTRKPEHVAIREAFTEANDKRLDELREQEQGEPVAWMDGYRNLYSLEEKSAGCPEATIPLVPLANQQKTSGSPINTLTDADKIRNSCQRTYNRCGYDAIAKRCLADGCDGHHAIMKVVQQDQDEHEPDGIVLGFNDEGKAIVDHDGLEEGWALYTAPPAAQPALKPLTDEKNGILLAISNAGLTLLKTQHGYELQKLSPIEAQSSKQEHGKPLALDVTLDGDEAILLYDTLGDDREDLAPVRLVVGDGHSGYGLYVAQAEYQDEGAVLLAAITPPSPQQRKCDNCGEFGGCCQKQGHGELVAGYFYTNDNGCYIECDPKHRGEEGVVPLYTTPQQRKPQFKEFVEWANSEGYDTAHAHDGVKWICLNPMTNECWKAWQAAHGIKGQP